ncbi:MAG: hypothetical protein AAGJ46_17630, partial [Planctomycetota bacterium]
ASPTSFDIQAMIEEDSKIYVGGNNDPSDTATAVQGTAWNGIANYLAAKSPLVSDTFVTNFNYGLGRKYAIEGEVSGRTEWNNIGLQDVLPTWRWVVDTTDPTPLEASFDFDEAFHGGSSVLVAGSLDADTTLPLYLASMPVHTDTKLQLAFKTGEIGQSSAELRVAFEGDESNPVSFPLGATTHGGWNRFSTELGNFDGQTIASIGLHFTNRGDPDYRINLGRLGVIRGEIDTPEAPTNATAQSVTIDGDTADVRLLWDHSADYSRDENNRVYNYNVFRRQADGDRTFLGGASTNALFLKDLKRADGELVTVLEVEAVGNEFGVSATDNYEVRWETTAVITIDRQTGAVALANPLAAPIAISNYSITAPGGVLDSAQWTSLQDQAAPGWQEDSATATELGESSTGGPLVFASDTNTPLGRAFTPTQIAFGQDDENVSFEYTADGQTVQANVVFVGQSSNNLTLKVDTATGVAILENTSTFDVAIDAYQLRSIDGALDPTGWTSLADQGESGWEESNPSNNQLAEVNFSDALQLDSGESVNLGALFRPGAFEGLTFDFLTTGSSDVTQGAVVYESLRGDFNADGVVDAADYTVWRDGLGLAFDLSDYQDWASNFGASLAGPLATSFATAIARGLTVPEPPAAALLALSVFAAFQPHSRLSAERVSEKRAREFERNCRTGADPAS